MPLCGVQKCPFSYQLQTTAQKSACLSPPAPGDQLQSPRETRALKIHSSPSGACLGKLFLLCILHASGCTTQTYNPLINVSLVTARCNSTNESKSPLPRIAHQLTFFPHRLHFSRSLLAPRFYALQLEIFLETARYVAPPRMRVFKLSTKSHNEFPFVTARSFKLWPSDEHFKLEKD